MCTYPLGIEYAGIDPTSQKRRINNLCTCPLEIEYARTYLIQVRREESLNSCTYPKGIEYVGTIEEVEIEIETKVTSRKKPH